MQSVIMILISDDRWSTLFFKVDFIVYLGSLLEQGTWYCSSVYGNLGVYLFYFRRPAVQVLMCGCDRSWLACSNKSSSHTSQ